MRLPLETVAELTWRAGVRVCVGRRASWRVLYGSTGSQGRSGAVVGSS